MKLSNSILLDNVFVEALKFFSKLHLPITISFMLDKCLEVMQKELEFVNKKREDLIKKYGVASTDERGTSYDVFKSSPENQKSFVSEMNELLAIEFELPIEKKLEVSLKKIENIEISTEYVNKLKFLLDFKE